MFDNIHTPSLRVPTVLRTNISHFVKNTHAVKFHIAYMRIPKNDKIPPPQKKKKKKQINKKILHFAYDFCH